MSFPDRRTVNILLTILLFAVVLALTYVARAVIVIFCFGILFAYLIDPVVRFLQRHSLLFKNLRGPHVAEAYLGLLILIAVLFHTLAPGSLGRTFKAVQQLPGVSERLSNGEIATDVADQYRMERVSGEVAENISGSPSFRHSKPDDRYRAIGDGGIRRHCIDSNLWPSSF